VGLDDPPDAIQGAKAELAKRLNEIEAAEAKKRGDKNIVHAFTEGASQALMKIFNRKRVQFKLVFHCLKNHRPMVEYESLQQVLATEPKFVEGMPKKHLSDDSGWSMAEAINHVLVTHMKDLLKKATAFSITVDASAAVNRTDYLNVEARLFHDGELHLVFICMKKLGLQTSARQQMNCLLTALAEFAEVSLEDLQKKLVAVAADGCAAMQGHRGGLLPLLQKKCPHMLAINCTAHKVNLAAEICDTDAGFSRISTVIREVAGYINASCLRTERLQELQELLQLEKVKPITVNDTRWMPLYGALKNMLKFYPAALALLRQDRDSRSGSVLHAKTLYNELTSAPVLFGLHAIMPLLSSLEHLTKVVQSQHLYPGDVAQAVDACKNSIKTHYIEKDNQQTKEIKFKELYGLCKFGSGWLFTNNSDGTVLIQTHDATTSEIGDTVVTAVRPTTATLKEVPRCSGVPVEELPVLRLKKCAEDAIKAATKVANDVVKELEKRLPSTELMKALCIFTPRYWIELCIKEENTRELFNQPYALLEVLIKQFGGTKRIAKEAATGAGSSRPEFDFVAAMVDRSELNTQYTHFQQFMIKESMSLWDRLVRKNNQQETGQQLSNADLMKHAGGEAVVNFWKMHLASNLEYISEFLKLRDIAISVPFGSVENERRFSAMNLTLTFLRNAMGGEHFNAAMRVRATPLNNETFNYWAAFMLWWNDCGRRGASM